MLHAYIFFIVNGILSKITKVTNFINIISVKKKNNKFLIEPKT